MADFSTSAELELEVSNQSLRSVRSTIEQELGDIEVGVSTSGAGGGGRQQGQLAGILDAERRQFELAEERNAVLLEMLDELEEGVGGGGSGLLPFGAGALATSGGGAAGGGLLGSILGGGGAAVNGLAGIAGIAAAGPLLGGALGIALREAGLGPRANDEVNEGGAMEPPGGRPTGGGGGGPQMDPADGRFTPDFTTGGGGSEAPGFEPGERDWRFETSYSAGDRETTINVDASPNREEIIREVERARRRDLNQEIQQLRNELMKALGGESSGRSSGGGGRAPNMTIQ